MKENKRSSVKDPLFARYEIVVYGETYHRCCVLLNWRALSCTILTLSKHTLIDITLHTAWIECVPQVR